MPFDGYLNVISIDNEDNVTIMYPNKFAPENVRRRQGLVSMPDARFGWAAQAPFGPTRFIAIATVEPFNLFQDSLDYDSDGQPIAPFLSPAPSSTRGLGRRSTTSSSKPAGPVSFGAGQITFDTCFSGC